MRKLRQVVLCLMASIFGGSMMLAQLPTGTILGVVKDSTGAVVPNAQVSARNVDTGQLRTVATNAEGIYRLESMPVGNYTIDVQAAGFSKQENKGLALDIGQEEAVNFTLQVGSATQTVEVTTEASAIDTTSGSLSSLVTQEQIADLPLNGRNYADLTLLQPGVTKSLNSNNSTIGYNGTAYSANGMPQRSNTYLLDGALQMSLSGNNGASALGSTLGVDGIQEYRVITNSIDAEYGMTMGSQQIVVTKSGTNRFHGGVFEFIRNNIFDARNYFDLPPSSLNGHRNPPFRRNQFGGSAGGPIVKDKVFFFGVYEGLRAFLATTNTATTLGTMLNPNGCHAAAGVTVTLAQCPQLGAPSAVVNPNMAQFLPLYPAPNLPGVTASGVAGAGSNYGFNFSQLTPENYAQGRIDYILSAKDSIFGRYTIDQSSLPFVGQFNGNYSSETSKNQFITLADNHIFSTSVVNSARVSFSREPLALTETYTNSLETGAAFQFASIPSLGMGSLTPTGASGIGASTLSPRHQYENIFTESDDVVYEKGKHSFKFGALVNHYQYAVVTHGYDRGVIGFSSVAGLMQGGAGPGTECVVGGPGPALGNTMNPAGGTALGSACITGGVAGVTEPTPTLTTMSLTVSSNDDVSKYLHFNTMGFYGQDSWKILPRLTINFGLRYEPTTTVNEIKGHASTLQNFPTSPTFTIGNAVFQNPGLKNLSPRFGFALDVFGNGKTAFRGGADLLYDLATWGQTYMNFAGYDPPFSDNLSVTNYNSVYANGGNTGEVYQPMAAPLVIPTVSNFQISYRGPTWQENEPHSIVYNVSLQQQLPWQTTISLAYAGSHGINLIQVLEGNNVLPSGTASTNSTNGAVTCALAAAGTTLNNASQYDGSSTSCYAINTSGAQCWPAMGITTNCWNRLNSNLPSMIFNPATGESFYNSFQGTVNKHIGAGIQFQVGYTYAKLNDNQQGGSGQDGNDMAEEPLHTKSMYGPALFDVRNAIHVNALYRIPKIPTSNRFVGGAVNGFWMAGIFSAQTGYPFGLEESGDREYISYLPSFATRDSPDRLPGRSNRNITHGTSSGCGSIASGTPVHTLTLWYDPCAYSIQPAGFIGTEPRNDLRGPGLQDLDISIVKDTGLPHLGEGAKLEFRAEFFDVMNHPNFTLPSQSISAASCAVASGVTASISTLAGCNFGSTATSGTVPVASVSGTAGAISSTLGGSGGDPQGAQRQLQFGLKIMF